MFRGKGRGGGEYTVLEVKGYPGDVVQYIGEVPPGLNRKCLRKHKFLISFRSNRNNLSMFVILRLCATVCTRNSF